MWPAAALGGHAEQRSDVEAVQDTSLDSLDAMGESGDGTSLLARFREAALKPLDEVSLRTQATGVRKDILLPATRQAPPLEGCPVVGRGTRLWQRADACALIPRSASRIGALRKSDRSVLLAASQCTSFSGARTARFWLQRETALRTDLARVSCRPRPVIRSRRHDTRRYQCPSQPRHL
jgi:hypothetical protein